MRVTITCEDCGERHRLERRVDGHGPIWIVCHGCEMPLRAVLEEATVAEQTAEAELRTPFAKVWGGTFDLGIGAV